MPKQSVKPPGWFVNAPAAADSDRDLKQAKRKGRLQLTGSHYPLHPEWVMAPFALKLRTVAALAAWFFALGLRAFAQKVRQGHGPEQFQGDVMGEACEPA